MRYFYFSPDDKKLRHGDNRAIKTGITHKVECKPVLCKAGLHASKNIMDALSYAPGSYLWVVELGGQVIHGDDKSCATERKYVAGFNAEKVLRKFARKVALINIKKIKPYCAKKEYNLIVEYLTTGNERLQLAARSAAGSAARSAAYSAASAASCSAARYAAYFVACYVARSAVSSVAYFVARSVAYYEACFAARKDFEQMLFPMLPTRIQQAYKG